MCGRVGGWVGGSMGEGDLSRGGFRVGVWGVATPLKQPMQSSQFELIVLDS